MKVVAYTLSLCLAASVATAQQQPVEFHWLGKLPGRASSSAYALSEDGAFAAGASGNRAFRWSVANGMEDLGILPGTVLTDMRGMSLDGRVIGGTCMGENGSNISLPFRWTPEEGIVALTLPPGGVRGAVAAVSGDGRVIGGTWAASLIVNAANPTHAVVWIDGVPQGVPRVSASNPIAMVEGLSYDGSVRVGANVWVVPGASPFPSGGRPIGVSDDGTVVLGTTNAGETLFWPLVNGIEPLHAGGAPVPFTGWMKSASNRGGLVVGATVMASGLPSVQRARVWNHRGVIQLSDLMTQYGVDLEGALLTLAIDISPDGRSITGQGHRNGAHEAFLLRLPVECRADLAGPGATLFPDGRLDNNDWIVFIDGFFQHRVYADVGTAGGGAGRDFAWSADDFLAFIDSFFEGCE